MRAVVQRVRGAAVIVDGERLSAIGEGLVVFVGVAEGDDESDADALARKLAGLRIFGDEEGRMNRSVVDVGGSALVVSQFTLYGDVRRGRRPSFSRAADPALAEPLVERVATTLEVLGVPTGRGRFRAHMEVDLTNDGPVTILVEVTGGRVTGL